MQTKRGLLAFLATLVALTVALLHVPFVSGAKHMLYAFSGPTASMDDPLMAALTPPDAPAGLSAPGAFRQLRLAAIRSETRSDDEMRRMASLHQIPFPVMKAHLAQVSKGVLDSKGLFWIPDVEKIEKGPDSAQEASLAKSQKLTDARSNLKRLEKTAARLGEFRQSTGSVNGALLAWITGPQRARRVIALSDKSMERDLESLRRHMIVPYRSEARQWLCTVRGLALALESHWPTRSRRIRSQSMGVVQLDAKQGEPVLSPMKATIGFVGPDGARGLCVEMIHACGLRSELCGLANIQVKTGQHLGPGSPVGRSGKAQINFRLWYGLHRLNPLALLPPEPETSP